ncbi:hypothetical protein [Gordonia sp. (in: high G+C Gram-positive bacteria)]
MVASSKVLEEFLEELAGAGFEYGVDVAFCAARCAARPAGLHGPVEMCS